MEFVIYWFDNNQFAVCQMENQRAVGTEIWGNVTIDLSKIPARNYVGVENWFSKDLAGTVYVDCSTHGSEPGQWEHIDEAVSRLLKAVKP